MPYSFDEELDLSNDLDGFEDIISAKPCRVTTTIKERGIDTYLCIFNISIELTLVDSVTLDGIPYKIETDAEEIFSTDNSIEDAFIIDGITLDTKEAIVTNILINKPMSVTNSNFDDEINDDFDGENINPAFAALKDLL
ncbi:MAG: YceD family protein [Anaeroplasma sp.]